MKHTSSLSISSFLTTNSSRSRYMPSPPLSDSSSSSRPSIATEFSWTASLSGGTSFSNSSVDIFWTAACWSCGLASVGCVLELWSCFVLSPDGLCWGWTRVFIIPTFQWFIYKIKYWFNLYIRFLKLSYLLYHNVYYELWKNMST